MSKCCCHLLWSLPGRFHCARIASLTRLTRRPDRRSLVLPTHLWKPPLLEFSRESEVPDTLVFSNHFSLPNQGFKWAHLMGEAWVTCLPWIAKEPGKVSYQLLLQGGRYHKGKLFQRVGSRKRHPPQSLPYTAIFIYTVSAAEQVRGKWRCLPHLPSPAMLPCWDSDRKPLCSGAHA